jgi:hypothetical protein
MHLTDETIGHESRFVSGWIELLAGENECQPTEELFFNFQPWQVAVLALACYLGQLIC